MEEEYYLRLYSVDGPFRCVKTVTVTRPSEALALVTAYAAENGFSNVNQVDDGEGSLRFTAKTPGGRAGRNLASLDL